MRRIIRCWPCMMWRKDADVPWLSLFARGPVWLLGECLDLCTCSEMSPGKPAHAGPPRFLWFCNFSCSTTISRKHCARCQLVWLALSDGPDLTPPPLGMPRLSSAARDLDSAVLEFRMLPPDTPAPISSRLDADPTPDCCVTRIATADAAFASPISCSRSSPNLSLSSSSFPGPSPSALLAPSLSHARAPIAYLHVAFCHLELAIVQLIPFFRP